MPEMEWRHKISCWNKIQELGTYGILELQLKSQLLHLHQLANPFYILNCFHGKYQSKEYKWSPKQNKIQNEHIFRICGEKVGKIFSVSLETVVSLVELENVLLNKKGGWQQTRGWIARGWPHLSSVLLKGVKYLTIVVPWLKLMGSDEGCTSQFVI